jgi:hypothetical protein
MLQRVQADPYPDGDEGTKPPCTRVPSAIHSSRVSALAVAAVIPTAAASTRANDDFLMSAPLAAAGRNDSAARDCYGMRPFVHLAPGKCVDQVVMSELPTDYRELSVKPLTVSSERRGCGPGACRARLRPRLMAKDRHTAPVGLDPTKLRRSGKGPSGLQSRRGCTYKAFDGDSIALSVLVRDLRRCSRRTLVSRSAPTQMYSTLVTAPGS